MGDEIQEITAILIEELHTKYSYAPHEVDKAQVIRRYDRLSKASCRALTMLQVAQPRISELEKENAELKAILMKVLQEKILVERLI
jgi:hypothetical protein